MADSAMKASGITHSEMVERMRTSRSQVARLLDPDNTLVQLDTLLRAARAVGRGLKLELVRRQPGGLFRGAGRLRAQGEKDGLWRRCRKLGRLPG
jgi:transcriptional regulator with XRE-family HTH domain